MREFIGVVAALGLASASCASSNLSTYQQVTQASLSPEEQREVCAELYEDGELHEHLVRYACSGLEFDEGLQALLVEDNDRATKSFLKSIAYAPPHRPVRTAARTITPAETYVASAD